MQRSFRHSFWAEVYESVLASYITAPTLLALINPKLGKFNVTAKGGQIEKNYFDWAISRPYLFLLLLNLIGFVAGHRAYLSALARAQRSPDHRPEPRWTALQHADPRCERRGRERAPADARDASRGMQMPVMLKFSTGRTLACETIDYSEGGVGVELPSNIEVPMHERVTVSLFRGDEEYAFPATVGFTDAGRVGLRFGTLTREQEYEFVKTTFARADAWTGWAEGRQPDTPLRGLSHVLLVGTRGIVGLFEHLYSDFRTWSARPPDRTQEAENQRLKNGQRHGEVARE